MLAAATIAGDALTASTRIATRPGRASACAPTPVAQAIAPVKEAAQFPGELSPGSKIEPTAQPVDDENHTVSNVSTAITPDRDTLRTISITPAMVPDNRCR